MLGRRVGEVLPPLVAPALAGLGLLERFRAQGHLPAFALHTVWGDGAPTEVDLTFHPYGPGWHVDRAAFDGLLLAAASERGAHVRRGTTVRSVASGPNGWEVQLAGAGGGRVEASFVIDASGRAATVARRIAAAPRLHDDGVALVGFLQAGPTHATQRVVTIIEAAADGWWYAGRLPGGRVVAAFLSDADLLPREPRRFAGFWQERLAATSLVAAHCAGGAVEAGPSLVRTATSRLGEVGGDRWLAVGDAAMAFDPLSSQGVCAALESGRQGGLAADRALAGDPRAVDAYAAVMETTFRDYLQLRAFYYGREGRWPASTFWQRRREETQLSA